MSYSWTIEGPAGSGFAPSKNQTELLRPDQFGTGIVLPFRRVAPGDFDSDSGRRLIASNIRLILKTPIGKLPWNPQFGSKLYLLRHSNNDEDLGDLARIYVSDALQRWEPRIRVRDVTAGALSIGTKNTLQINITYSLGRLIERLGVDL